MRITITRESTTWDVEPVTKRFHAELSDEQGNQLALILNTPEAIRALPVFAAAPDLLAALQEALTHLEGLMAKEGPSHLGPVLAKQIHDARCEAYHQARAAIAKATGGAS